MIVMREVFKRDKPLDNGSGAVSLCVFHSNVKSDECGALTVTPTKDYCRRCAFYKTREDFDRGLACQTATQFERDRGRGQDTFPLCGRICRTPCYGKAKYNVSEKSF